MLVLLSINPPSLSLSLSPSPSVCLLLDDLLTGACIQLSTRDVWIWGGADITQRFNDAVLVDVETHTVRPCYFSGDVPSLAREGACCVPLGKHRLFVWGGFLGLGRYTDEGFIVHTENPQHMIWQAQRFRSSQQLLPAPRAYHTAVLIAPHRVLVFGGNGANNVVYSDAFVFESSGVCEAVQFRGEMPSLKMSHVALMIAENTMLCLVGSSVSTSSRPSYVGRGSTSSGGAVVQSTGYVMDTDTFEWKRVENMSGDVPPPLSKAAAVMIGPTRVLVCGGLDTTRNFSPPAAYLLDTESMTWTRHALPSTADTPMRYSHSLTMVAPGKALVFGGMLGSKLSNTYFEVTVR